MSDAKGSGNDPSMDDILASIRKIISDDEARAQVSGGAAPPPSAPVGPVAGPAPVPPPPAKRDDVLLLTDLVDEPKTVISVPPRPTLVPPPPARIDPVSAAEMPQPSILPMPPPSPPAIVPMPPIIAVMPPVLPVEPPVKQPPADHTSLVEPMAAGLAASAFDRLSQAVQESVPQPVAHDPGPAVGSSGRNLEDIVKELLRPMMKEWLDKNLPAMVERFVEREIVRLTRR